MAERSAPEPFFTEVPGPVPYLGPEADEALAFRWYDRERTVAGRTMEDHLRLAVCYWHSFCWDGSDVFGRGTFDRPWLAPAAGDPLGAARRKAEVAFELFEKLGVPFFCFHDVDLAPEGDHPKETAANLEAMVEVAAEHMARTGVGLLWGTANLFAHPRYANGAATNPDPEVFAWAGAQVARALEATHRLGGQAYVLWGGREGYDTLLNTDLGRERAQLARFLHLVVEHKHRIGFEGTLLIEPKPFEPVKHQYDHDVETVHAFLQQHGLADELKVNIEVNHATLAGLDFHHEVAMAVDAGIFGSVDANAGDDRLGWDVDRFPTSVETLALGLYEILRAGGLQDGGFNFDAKLRRASVDRTDLVHAHVGAIDALAHALLVADLLLREGEIEAFRTERYARWDESFGRALLAGEHPLADLRDRSLDRDEPAPASGRQEALENLVARAVDRAR